MKPLFILIALVSLFSSHKDDSILNRHHSTNYQEQKILPLGASRVEGNSPIYESYRYELWKDLVAHHLRFDFVGSKTDDSNYPMFNNLTFDNNHQGTSGYTSGQILQELTNWINQSSAPDITLLSSPGGNDALQNLSYNQALSNINAIIDVLQTANPNMTIIIEQMAPGHSSIMTPDLIHYINQMNQEVVNISSSKSTANSQIIVVDMYTGFTDAMLADDVHYNELGADFIAHRYYTTISSLLN